MKKKYDVIRFILKCTLIPASAIAIVCTMNHSYKKIDAQKYQDILKFDRIDHGYWEIRVGNLGSSHGAYDFVIIKARLNLR